MVGLPIEGRWRILESELWDLETLDLVVPAFIRLDPEGLGEMRLIAIGASIDYRVVQRDGASVLEFSWAGFDEMEATSGRGWARVDADTMRGTLYIHQGDESTFVARREDGAPDAPMPSAPPSSRQSGTPGARAASPGRGLRNSRPGARRRAGRGTGAARPVVGRRAGRVRRSDAVYEFRVVLLEVATPIWRTIQVPATYSFWDLHVAIQDAMGWLDYHLHVFRVSRPGTADSVQIGIPDEDAFEGDEPILPGWEVPIKSYFTHPGTAAGYEYDFGDGWEHRIILEAVLPRQKGVRYPRCLAGERACPPEDCGGVGGYEHLMEVMSDPLHEEYEGMLQWLGGRFAPERFNPKRVKFEDPRKRWKKAFA